MRKADIEYQVLQIVDRAQNGQSGESSFIELKSKWCDPSNDGELWHWAKQIAGMGNAARGDPFLWVVGVDDAEGVSDQGAGRAEWSTIYRQISSRFEGDAPSPTEVLVNIGDKTVFGIQFDSDRAPYVLKRIVPRDTPVSEVYWREGTGTEYARHEDLVKILVPTAQMPNVTVLEGKLIFNHVRSDDTYRPRVVLILFIAPPVGQFATFPYNKMSANLNLAYKNGPSDEIKFEKIEARAGMSLSPYVTSTDYDITAERPGALELILWTEIEHTDSAPGKYESFEVNLILPPVFANRAIHIDLVGLGRELAADSGDASRYSCELRDRHSTHEDA